jgi:hypothetical protein
MMTSLFDYITRLSLRLRWITIAITLVIWLPVFGL